MRKILISLINVYQKTLSPDYGWFKGRYPYGYCKHYPSCSEYTKQALQKYGILKGFFLGIIRIIKCNPWAKPKVDVV